MANVRRLPKFLKNADVPGRNPLKNWNDGIMASWIGGTLKEVGGASACSGLEAEGQEFVASCLSEAILKRSAP